MKDKQLLIEKAWGKQILLEDEETRGAIKEVIALLDRGKIRVAEPMGDSWKVNEWVKKAIGLYFIIQQEEVTKAGPMEFYDKIELKNNYKELKVRAVPNVVARYGSYVGPDVVMMPSFVNIGAYIGKGTLLDTGATIGSGAQIGENVNIGCNVVIGGVLIPVQTSPVIIGDDCFIGTGCVIEEGFRMGKEVIVGINTILTTHTHIIDVSGIEQVEYRGFIPARSIVMMGSTIKKFPAGEFNVPVALIIGKRVESEDKSDSLHEALNKYNLAV